MKRLVLDILQTWKLNPDRYPLLLRGARQVGKTWVIREHGRLYSHFVEINLEAEPEYISLFKDHYGDPHSLLRAIGFLKNKKIEEEGTLLFIDEIQSSPEALLSLRYFREKKPGFPVIAAGSLLEFTLKEISFPVGRIQFIHLFPMNFEEYLLAQKKEDLLQAIFELPSQASLPNSVHEKLLEEVALYYFIGGMPKVLQTYVDSGDLVQCQEHQQMIVANFREDFHKYASRANLHYLQILFQAVPRWIGQKFTYSRVDPHLRSRELSTALNLLEQAGLVYKAYHSSANGSPLGSQINPKKFKVFFLDVGLCQRILGLNLSQLYLQRKDLLAHRGSMAEQWVAQELLSYTPKNQSPEIYYWQREEKSALAEVDLLLQKEASIFPFEVKSGEARPTKSLNIFLNEKEKYIPRGFIVSTSPYFKDSRITQLPFYALPLLEKNIL